MVRLSRLCRWLGVALAAWPTLALAAQDAAPSPHASRSRLPGFVTDNAGRRVPGARVFLVSRPMPARLDLGGEDVIETQTDANGLFRADLLSGRGYTAWALWRDGKGTARRSQFAEGVVPGPPRALEEDAPQVLRRVCINGLAAWEARAPFRVQAFAIGESQKAFELVLDAEGRVELPDLSVTAKICGAVSVDGKWASSPELPLVLEQRDLDGVRLVIDLAETRR